MKLFEFEGKSLIKKAGIKIPAGKIITNLKDIKNLDLEYPLVVKPQLLSGKRGKRGLIKTVKSSAELTSTIKKLLGKKVETQKIESILVEELILHSNELFVSFTYSTETRSPIMLFSTKGGTNIENANAKTFKLSLDSDFNLKNIKINKNLLEIIKKLYYDCFLKYDLFLLEINPLVVTDSGDIYALDAKIITDDSAHFRQIFKFAPRNHFGLPKSTAEAKAEKIDAHDHRGVVGRVYMDLPGDIAVISSGGGASLVAMDALAQYNGSPANYTEFSGNPPAKKVKKLTQIVLSKKNLKGCLVIGGKANFTDIHETMKGFLEALRSIKPAPTYPIVIRRDGPNRKEAFEMLESAAKTEGWKFYLYDSNTSITEATKKIVELTK